MLGVVLGTEDIASVPLERAVRFQEESVLEATPVPEHTLEGLPGFCLGTAEFPLCIPQHTRRRGCGGRQRWAQTTLIPMAETASSGGMSRPKGVSAPMEVERCEMGGSGSAWGRRPLNSIRKDE